MNDYLLSTSGFSDFMAEWESDDKNYLEYRTRPKRLLITDCLFSAFPIGYIEWDTCFLWSYNYQNECINSIHWDKCDDCLYLKVFSYIEQSYMLIVLLKGTRTFLQFYKCWSHNFIKQRRTQLRLRNWTHLN